MVRLPYHQIPDCLTKDLMAILFAHLTFLVELNILSLQHKCFFRIFYFYFSTLTNCLFVFSPEWAFICTALFWLLGVYNCDWSNC